MRAGVRLLVTAALALASSTTLAAGRPASCTTSAGEQYSGSLPPNFRLLPACVDALRLGKGGVLWVFQGHATVSGDIRAAGEESGSTSLFPDPVTQRQLPDAIRYVQLDDRRGNRALRVPQTSRSAKCFSTRATIQFSELAVLSDGTDQSGQWVRDYKLLSRGRWQPCTER